MFARFSLALLRAVLVGFFIILTSTFVALSGSVEGDLFILAIAVLLGVFIFLEYISDVPAVLEFRYAPPYNRIRFLILVCVALTLSSGTNSVSQIIGLPITGSSPDFVVNVFSSWPSAGYYLNQAIGQSATTQSFWLFDNTSLAFFIGVLCVLAGGIYIWISSWPLGDDGFSLWPNMPSFNPTSGRRASDLLATIALINVTLFFGLPYALSYIIALARQNLGFDFLYNPVFTFWVLMIWLVVPLFALFKAIALLKLCVLAENLRRLESNTE